MTLGLDKRAVGVFPSRREAESALHELRNVGFPMDKVSVVAQDADRADNIAGADVSDRVGNKADEGAGYGAAAGGTLGGIGGLLVGLGTLAIPGIGPIMLAGAAATTLATTAAGIGIGAVAGGLIGGLIGLGIPEERARVYNDRVSRGEYLVIVDGTENEVRQAEAILHRQGIQEWGVYNPPNAMAGTNTNVTDSYDTTGVATSTGYASTTTGLTTGIADRQMRAVGVFNSRQAAESALTELRDSGFSMDRVSVIARDMDQNDQLAGADVSDRVGNQAREGAGAGAVTGTALGGLGGLLVGLGALAIPGIGPIVLAGAGATALATTAAGAGIGAAAGGLVGGLVGLGIPEDRARVYNERVSRGDYLVMVDGTEAEIQRAATVLSRRGIQDWGIYNAPNTNTTRENYGTTGTSTVDTTTRTDYPGTVTHGDPDVVIIDRRDPDRK
jgi:hypothetical protein